MTNNGKKIVLTEDLYESAISDIILEAMAPKREQVLIVKDYLDKNFKKSSMDDIDENGYPIKRKMISMLSGGSVGKEMNPDELVSLLNDHFINIIKKDEDRKNFLKSVIIDWYNNDIDKYGILSTNTV